MTKCYLLLTFCSPNAKCLVDVSFFANNVSNCLVSILFVCIFALVFEQNIFVDNIPADFTKEVHDGEMTLEEVLERYEEWDKEHSQG